MQIEAEEAQILRQLFGHAKCAIQNLEMEELEVSENNQREVVDSVCLLNRLFTFDFSNNQLPISMAQNLVFMLNKYQEMEVLCLDHSEMEDQVCQYIFQTINNTQLLFLNISWNFLTGDSIKHVTRILARNQNLEKLAMQHNRFGEGDLTEFAKVLSSHKSLKYLDIS